MSRRKTPSSLLNKPSGQARIRIASKDIYLGVYGSAESRQRYGELVHGWLVRNSEAHRVELTIGELSLLLLGTRTKTLNAEWVSPGLAFRFTNAPGQRRMLAV